MSDVQSTKRRRPGRRISQTCPTCQKTFEALAIEVNRGAGIFCSTVCYHKSRSRPLAERFWEKVEKTDGCWIWTGAKSEFGYGVIHDPASARAQKHKATHRLSWEMHNGPIPEGSYVLHRCDNPACVNPAHLFLGTLKDNTQDMLRKRRHLVKLTDEQVGELRNRYAAGGVSQTQLANEFGIAQTTVSRILLHKNHY
jgi:HNH endonuclease